MTLLIKYGVPAIVIIALLLWVDNRGYERGHADAEKTCTEKTVPEAEAIVQARCDLLTKATKEENDALSHNLNRLRGTYDRLRQQKPVANCVPIATAGAGNAGTNETPQHPERVGVTTEWLDFAFYEVATDIQLGESCQRQLKRIYEMNNALPANDK